MTPLDGENGITEVLRIVLDWKCKKCKLFLPYEVPVVRPPRTYGVCRSLLLPFHFFWRQLHKLIGDIAEVRHRRIDGNGALVDQVDGIVAAVVVRFTA